MGIAPEEYTKNSSGQGKLSIIPIEIRGWNWGAFFFGWLWVGCNLIEFGKAKGSGIVKSRIALLRSKRFWLSLLSIMPYVGLIVCIVLGMKGNKWAWQGKKWDSIEHFKRTQRKWGISAAVVFVAGVVIIVIYTLVIGLLIPNQTG